MLCVGVCVCVCVSVDKALLAEIWGDKEGKFLMPGDYHNLPRCMDRILK